MKFFVFSLSCFLVFFTLFDPVDCQCDNCMDGISTLGCPSPSLCGYRPFDCTPCLASPSSSPSSNCTAPLSLWCVNVSCHQCIDRMPSQGCRDPAVCGFQPMPCKGCVKGKAMPGCPHPEWCGNFSVGTPPCYRCMDGMVMPHCPDPHQCGYEAACQDCMPGMPMPSCPDPDACAAAGEGAGGCVTQMYFHLDDSACILIKRWNIGEKGEWVIAVILIIMAAYAREGIAFYRSYRLSARKKAKNLNQSKPKYSTMDNCNAGGELKNSSSNDSDATIMPSLVSLLPSHHSWDLAIDSFCYCLQQALSYLLMLVIMTYSFYLFITVIGGFSVAHFTINYSWAKIKQKKTKDLLTNISIMNESINANIINNDNNNNNSNNNGVTGVTGASGVDPEQKTGGDHCCEDFEFDD